MCKEEVITALQGLVENWKDAAGEESILELHANVGLFLYDLAKYFGLNDYEVEKALGTDVMSELKTRL